VTTTTSTTIAGVSVLDRAGEPAGRPFDLGVSSEGIEIRRPGQPARHMSWSRVTEWELEEHDDDVLLTLRGHGAVTPLRITGWSAGDLEALMRTVTSDTVEAPDDADVTVAHQPGAGSPAPAPAPAAGMTSAFATDSPETEGGVAPPASRQERRRRRRTRVGAKAVLAIGLLVLLAGAVALVLLQSAGVIHWGFLGPTA
jgi:hypothetical protein